MAVSVALNFSQLEGFALVFAILQTQYRHFPVKANCKASWLCRSISGPMSTVAISP
jgi:hypothetical protein